MFLTSCSSGTLITTGEVAPDFELNDIQGRAISLSDYSGRPMAVNFCGSD
jgi:peroxiredoxin